MRQKPDGWFGATGFSIRYDHIYLVGGQRTPFGKFCGTLGTISPTDLGIIAGRAALEKTGVAPVDINQVIFANIIQASFDAIYLPRHIGLYCGLPRSVPAALIQRICGSGLEAIIMAAEQISLGKAEVVLAGGAENMSLAPTSAFGNRMGYPLGRVNFGDMLWEGLSDPAVRFAMGQTAENLARKYGLTRAEVDEYACRSHALALEKTEAGILTEEITPVSSGSNELEGLQPRPYRTTPKKTVLTRDENIRETSLEQLSQLQPVFEREGVQTPGNSSGIVDGAAAVIVASETYLENKGLTPLARIVASASAGVDPEIMGIGPVPAIRNVLQAAGLTMENIDLFEINEAFGAQVVAVERELDLDRDKLNVNGGAIAIGHPLAATGTRLTHTLALELRRRKGRYGIASACIGGGQGTAVLIESV